MKKLKECSMNNIPHSNFFLISFLKYVINYLKLLEARTLNIDDSTAVIIHKKILAKKPFLRKTYYDFYKKLYSTLPPDFNKKKIVEIGSGAGFIKEVIPSAITSDVQGIPAVDLNFSALNIPFKDACVDVFLMVGVFHHFSNTEKALKEMERCLKPNGKIIMIEPANTVWARFIWPVNGEMFDPKGEWCFNSKGRLSSANGALPWIVFIRDKNIFTKKFPKLFIKKITYHTPLKYLLSGGMVVRQLIPSCMYGLIDFLEKITSPLHQYIGMYTTIEIEKIRR